MDLIIVPCTVQGEKAPQSLRKSLEQAIKYSEKKEKIDAIVFTRGGGSIEDLWAFNHEKLIRDIYACPIPVISAVGHQIDFTLVDYVADLRCETPSAAAEVLTQSQAQLQEKMGYLQRTLRKQADTMLDRQLERLQRLNPINISDIIWNKFNTLQKRFTNISIFEKMREHLNMTEYNFILDDLISRNIGVINDKMNGHRTSIENFVNVLKVLNPEHVLGRGYSYLKNKDGRTVENYNMFKKIPTGQKLFIHLSGGKGEVKKDV